MKANWISIILLGTVTGAGADTVAQNGQFYRDAGSDLEIHRCEVFLDGDAFWQLGDTSKLKVERLYLVPPEEKAHLPQGRRMRAVVRQRHIERGRHSVSRYTWACREYALKHEGKGPASLDALGETQKKNLGQLNRSPWDGVPGVEVSPPYAFLVPGVKFKFSGPQTNWVQRQDRQLLAIELTPFVDDGKHWVGYTDYSAERVAIDPELLARHDLKVRPVMSTEEADQSGMANKPHVLVAVRKAGAKGDLSIPLVNTLSGDTLELAWRTSRNTRHTDVTTDLERARKLKWGPYAHLSFSPVMQAWMEKRRPSAVQQGNRRDQGETSSAFGVMGGRAAVRETLQMQSIGEHADPVAERTIAITNLQGVVVKSHPFEEMLAGKPGGRLPLANVVPPDRFVLYIAKPEAILPLLDEGADFLSHVGSVAAGNSIKYDLSDRYLERLGMDRDWLQRFLESGAVEEMAIVTPDLFFVDGTDVSVVSRLAKPKLIGPLLKLIGIIDLHNDGAGSGSGARRMVDGKPVYWALKDDLLFLGTDRSSMRRMMVLQATDGKGSLGRSAEFRYMLTQLPLSANTRMYAYLSDPFVRRLVGPETKIAQLRRVAARADMEYITGRALLAELDGKAPDSVAELEVEGYLPEGIQKRGYSLDEDLTVRSETYGSLSRMATFSETPVTMVSEHEARLYKRYVENYSRFWRQFFDPIAVRLDDTPDGALEMTTFILPLIDNSIYNGLKEVMHTREDGRPLKIPELTPPPLLEVSLNLKEQAWTEISKGLYDLFDNYAYINPAVLDDLGPGFHLAIHDADPVITLGSGDVLGVFGGQAALLGRNNEMLMIPMVLSLLTRPCTLVVETQNPEATLRYLRLAADAYPHNVRGSSWFDINMHQVAGRDEWIYTFNIENIVKFRYGLQVDGDYVLVRNIPWSSKDRIDDVGVADLHTASLRANPGACVLQLPGLHAAASDGARASALDSMGHIYPLLLSGVADLASVEDVHHRLFGFYPVHPGPGAWSWNGSKLTSSRFGTVLQQSAPTYDAENPVFGVMKDVDSISLGMQFEDTGLRTTVRWKLK